MFGLGFGELVIVFLIALIFIGPKKLPELAKGLGKGIRDFQNAAKGFSDQLQERGNEIPKTENKPTPTLANASQQSEDQKTESAPQNKNEPHS
jgi:sec-independent protein translocase protein TatA